MHPSRTRKDSTRACVVCCEEIEYFAVGQCDHIICHVCSVRMRVLGKENYCAVCRTDLDKVIITKDFGKWASLQDQLTKGYVDKNSGLCYTSKEIRNKVKELLEHRCRLCPDKAPERNFESLRDHMKREHHLFFCAICVAHHRKFSKEWKLYNKSELATHRRVGDRGDNSHKGHPLCQFCEERFLDDDELHRHLRKNHFWCHICEKDGKQLYYLDYSNLRNHFREDHYLCEEDMCKYEQFTSVFRSDIDFQAHRALTHSQKMSKAQVRQARQLEVDLVYNQRPVNQGRNITGQNYNEVRGSDQRPKRSKDHRKANRQEDLDLKTAIDNSLATPQPARQTPSPPSANASAEKTKDTALKPQLHQNDFPSLSETTGNSTAPSATAKKTHHSKATIASLEDFPNLTTNIHPNKPPPPGFGTIFKETSKKQEHKSAPPGLNPKMNKKSPPLNKKSESPNSENPPKSEKTNASVTTRKNNTLPVEKPKSLPQDPPLGHKNSASRNQALIENVKMLLGHDMEKFAVFKMLSGKFRQGHCSGKEYYMSCTSLFGADFNSIFNELVNLLPDPDKKLELLSVHNDYKALAKQNGQSLPQSNGIRQPPPQTAWGPKPAPVNQTKPVEQSQVKHDPKSKHDIDFPSLPPAEPRKMKPINMYRPTPSQPMKSAWVRGK